MKKHQRSHENGEQDTHVYRDMCPDIEIITMLSNVESSN